MKSNEEKSLGELFIAGSIKKFKSSWICIMKISRCSKLRNKRKTSKKNAEKNRFKWHIITGSRGKRNNPKSMQLIGCLTRIFSLQADFKATYLIEFALCKVRIYRVAYIWVFLSWNNPILERKAEITKTSYLWVDPTD